MKKELEELKKLLIIVDMVNGFVKEGNMADPSIAHIIPEQRRLIEQFFKEREGIAFIIDCHEEKCSEFKKFPIHCVKGTSEAELVAELKQYKKECLVYLKNSTSTIFAPNFMNDIEKMKKLREVVITGCCTDICVTNLAIPLQNYFDQKDLDVKIIVPTNAVETYDAPYHNREEYNNMAFKFLEQAGIHLVKSYGGMKYGK